jgi:hypothetical protein
MYTGLGDLVNEGEKLHESPAPSGAAVNTRSVQPMTCGQ